MKKNFIFTAIYILLTVAGCAKQDANLDQLLEEHKKYKENDNYYSDEILRYHNKASDCWITIDYIVFNVTDYLKLHPNEKSILRSCGQDATELFENFSKKKKIEILKYYQGKIIGLG